MKTLLTKTSLQSGKRLVMKIFAACVVYKQEIQILQRTASVGYQRESLRKGASWNVYIVDAVVAPAE